jgi:hypothetical protein
MTLLAGRRASRRIASAVLIATGTFAGALSVQAQSDDSSALSPALSSALAAYDEAWNSSDLAFSVSTFAEGTGTGYGHYQPRTEAIIADGEALSVYAEPVGYAFSENDGNYSYELTASYKLLNLSGQVLAEQDNFAVFSGAGRSKQRELGANLTFQFSGLPAGNYQLETGFADEIGGKQSSFTLPFTVSGTN